jgi:hypothetical protein
MTERLAANKSQNISPSVDHLKWPNETTPAEAKTKLEALADFAQSIFIDFSMSMKFTRMSTGSLLDILEGSSPNFGVHEECLQEEDAYPQDGEPEENFAMSEGRGFGRGGRGVGRGAGMGRGGGRTYSRYPESRHVPGQGRGRGQAGPPNLGPVATGSAFAVDNQLPPPPKVRAADWGNMKGKNGQILTCYNCDVEGHIASQCDRPAKARLRSVTESTAPEYVSRILGIDEGEVPQGFPPDEFCGSHVDLLADAVDAHYVARAAEEFRKARDVEVRLQDSQA